MIPLGDASRRPIHTPYVSVAIIAVNGFVFLLELLGGQPFVSRWSMVPASVSVGKDWATVFTAMFMHAGWLHILGNMLFLWVFGPEIEDLMAPFGFFTFYLLSGVAATIAQVAVDPQSAIPTLGASGAIAGVLGAFLITYPRDQIRTLLLFGWYMRMALLPASIMVGIWFLIQLISEIGSIAKVQAGGVAYMAHVGGFVFGLGTARLFESRARRQAQGLDD